MQCSHVIELEGLGRSLPVCENGDNGWGIVREIVRGEELGIPRKLISSHS